MKPSKLFSDVFEAAGAAINTTQDALGLKQDRALAMYGKLDVPDFRYIQKEYGTDGLAEYVREMERRRLVGGNNG